MVQPEEHASPRGRADDGAAKGCGFESRRGHDHTDTEEDPDMIRNWFTKIAHTLVHNCIRPPHFPPHCGCPAYTESER